MHDLFTDEDGTLLLTVWYAPDGTVERREIATRPEPGATWGPPVTVTHTGTHGETKPRTPLPQPLPDEPLDPDTRWSFVDALDLCWLHLPGQGWFNARTWDDLAYIPSNERARYDLQWTASLVALVGIKP